jgi:hypothetical protein
MRMTLTRAALAAIAVAALPLLALGGAAQASVHRPANASHYIETENDYNLDQPSGGTLNVLGTALDTFTSINQSGTSWYYWKDNATGNCLTYEGSGPPYYVYEATCGQYVAAQSWTYLNPQLANEQANDKGLPFCARAQSLTDGSFVVVGSCSGADAEWTTPDS